MRGDVADVINLVKLGIDLRGFGVTTARIRSFSIGPIGFAGRPYNSVSTTCYIVMIKWLRLLNG